jgi:hypothetical protein
MTPPEFGAALVAVTFSLDQPRAAEKLAKAIGRSFTTAHIASYLVGDSGIADVSIVLHWLWRMRLEERVMTIVIAVWV